MEYFNDIHNPVPVILSILSEIAKSDEIVHIIQQSGISIDLSLDPEDDYSHTTRIRAYIPRINKVFIESDPMTALHTLTVTSGTIIQHYPEKEDEIRERLKSIGWDYSGGEILPSENSVTELYFSKGLQHSAYVAIREIISNAKFKVTIIDQWIDRTIFELLKTLDSKKEYFIIVITKESKNDDFNHEMILFMKQYTNIKIQISHSNDFHDRFLIIDDECLYHLGASIKDTGKKVSIISKIETNQIIEDIIKKAKEMSD